MCGIAGHVVAPGNRPDYEGVETATRRLAHRGPDGTGIATFDTACLGHRRLSIIDVAGSPQPWSSEDGRYTITFNGEIYNYIELRRQLSDAGVRIRSNGDTEVLLAMYIHHGERCLEKLNGMFAFAIWDNATHRLFAARDRIGKKPLFYASSDRGIAFASEIEPLLVFKGVTRDLDPTAVHDFFAYQYVPAPRTIYRSIRKLAAAHFLRYENGQLTISQYWEPPRPSQYRGKEESVHEEARALLQDAVKLRLRSDVPVGAFLSGGLDSSIIVGLMKQLGSEVNTFHVGFDEASYDESASARTVAKHFGTRHHTQTLPLDQLAVLDKSLSHFGEPFADPSAIPTWHLCRYTRQTVTVALSGDGADELFGGYRRYDAGRFLGWYQRMPRLLRKFVRERLLAWMSETDAYYANSLVKKIRLFVHAAEQATVTPNDLAPQTFSLNERKALFTDLITVTSADHVRKFGLDDLDHVSRMMFTDTVTYLPEDILVKVDRMSMAHALEVRNPFLDHRVIEFACRLPLSHKIRGATQKRVLRTAFTNLLPPASRTRRKHGFAVPLGNWFRTSLVRPFQETVLDAAVTEIVNRRELTALWTQHQSGHVDHGFRLWTLFVFHRWYHLHARS